MPCRILQSLAATKRHAAPRPSIQLHKPHAPVLVAKQLEHEEAPPPRIPDELLPLRLDIIGHRLRFAGARPGALRIHHPNPVVTAPRPNPFRRSEAEGSLANSGYESLSQQGNAFLPLLDGAIQFSAISADPFSARIHAPLINGNTFGSLPNDGQR